MVIRPLALGSAMGEVGRSVGKSGEKNGSAPIFSRPGDTFSLSAPPSNHAKSYAPSLLFKMMGSVELMASDSRTMMR